MFNIHWTICVYILLDVMPYRTKVCKTRHDSFNFNHSVAFVGWLTFNVFHANMNFPTHNLHSHLCVIQSPGEWRKSALTKKKGGIVWAVVQNSGNNYYKLKHHVYGINSWHTDKNIEWARLCVCCMYVVNELRNHLNRLISKYYLLQMLSAA